MQPNQDVLEKVRRALGRSKRLEHPPIPPVIDDRIARLVHAQSGLAEVFLRSAESMKMKTAAVGIDQLNPKLIDFLREQNCRKIAVSASELLERLDVRPALRDAGFDVKSWRDITLDELYDDYDCAVTDVMYAVAETGSLVVHPQPGHGRALSLVPMIHVAIVEHKNIVPDLVDLFEKLAWPDQSRSNIILITGPSKTADIEMNVVTGVHGPNIVKVFIVS